MNESKNCATLVHLLVMSHNLALRFLTATKEIRSAPEFSKHKIKTTNCSGVQLFLVLGHNKQGPQQSLPVNSTISS